MDESLKSGESVEQTEPTALAEQGRRDEPPAVAGNASTAINYTLRFTGWPAIPQLVTIAVASAVYIVLSYLSIGIPSLFFGVSSIFIAIGFGIPFALWFGVWAFVIAYLGNFLGAGILSPQPLPLLVAIPFGATDFIQLCLPMILYRVFAKRFGVSPIGKDVYTLRGFLFFLVCAVLPNNIIGGLYGNIILILGGLNPWSALIPGWLSWSSTNIVVTIVIGSILLATLGPIVERFGLTTRDALK